MAYPHLVKLMKHSYEYDTSVICLSPNILIIHHPMLAVLRIMLQFKWDHFQGLVQRSGLIYWVMESYQFIMCMSALGRLNRT